MGSLRRCCVIAGLGCCLLVPGTAWGWSMPIDVSPSHEFDEGAAAAVNVHGDAAVAWFNQNDGYHSTIGVTVRPAGAAWSAAQTLGVPSDWQNDDPSVAVDADGDTMVVWGATNSGSLSETRAAFALAGQPFGTPVQISGTETGSAAADAYVAFDDSGTATAFWEQNDGRLYYADRPADGAFTAARQVPIDSSSSSADYPSYAVAGNGDAVVAWEGGYAIREGHGAFGPAQQLDPDPSQGPTQGGSSVHVAINDSGEAIAAWTESDGDTWSVKAAFRQPGAPSFGAPITVGHVFPGGGGYGANAAIDAAGDATVVWPGDSEDPFIYTGACAVVRHAGDSAFSAPIALGMPSAWDLPSVAYDQAGDTYVLWRTYDDTQNDTGRVLAEEAPVGGTFPGQPDTISSDDQNVSPPLLAAGGSSALAAWPIGDDSEFRIQESDSNIPSTTPTTTTTTTTSTPSPTTPTSTTTTPNASGPPAGPTPTVGSAATPAPTSESDPPSAEASPAAPSPTSAGARTPPARRASPTRWCLEPAVKGLALRAAERRLHDAGCGVHVLHRRDGKRRGHVIGASGHRGARYPVGHRVVLTVAE